MIDKLKVTRERNFSAHHRLIGAARLALEDAEAKRPGWSYSQLTTITLCGLALEAICNAIGDRVVPDWMDFDPAPPKAKLRIICNHLQVEYDKDKEPWGTITWLIKMRNRIAHAKPELIKQEFHWTRDEYDRRQHEQPLSELEKEWTLENAKRAFAATQKVLALLTQAIPLDKRIGLFGDAWHHTASASDAEDEEKP
jgi:hypothetical protein